MIIENFLYDNFWSSDSIKTHDIPLWLLEHQDLFCITNLKIYQLVCIAATEAFTLAKQKIKDLNTKLIEENRDKKSAKAALEGAERQGKSQRQQLRQTKD